MNLLTGQRGESNINLELQFLSQSFFDGYDSLRGGAAKEVELVEAEDGYEGDGEFRH